MTIRKLTAALSLLMIAGSVHAFQATGTIAVTASVVPPQPTCSVATTPLNFGIYNPTTATGINTTASVSVNCTNTTPYNVSFTSANAGTLTSTVGNPLNYFFTSDAAGAFDLFAAANSLTGNGTGVAITHTVYGSMAAGQVTGLPLGTTNQPYSDTITVNVVY
jgi:spore coat protein U-like protein